MKKLSLFILALISVSSSVLAGPLTSKECRLNDWCDLPRTSDSAYFPVQAKHGNIFTCTVAVDGDDVVEQKQVYVRLIGEDGFMFGPAVMAAPEGGSAVGTLTGNFTNGNSGKITVRRIVYSTTNKMAHVMCETYPN